MCEFTLDDIDALAEEAGLPAAPPPGDIHDPEDALTRQGRARLQDRIDRFEVEAGADLRVVVVPSVKPLQASEAAFWLFNRWSMGGERNRGVLFLLALRDRKIQCEVGYGLEGYLTDDEAGNVLDRHVVPLLRRGHVAEAMFQAVALVAELIELACDDGRVAAGRPVERGGARG